MLRRPAAELRALAGDTTAGWWVLARRPLLLALALGCMVSMQASGRLTARLILDGAISFAFVPVLQIAALAIVGRRTRRALPFSRLVDVFFAGNGPWLVWLLAFSLLRVVESPMEAAAPPAVLRWTLDASFAATIAWSARIDWHFFREVLPRPGESAWRDLLVARVVVWGAGIACFFGIAIWPLATGWLS